MKKLDEVMNLYLKEPGEENLLKVMEVISTIPLYLGYGEEGQLLVAQDPEGHPFLPAFSQRKDVEKVGGASQRAFRFDELKHFILLPDSNLQGILMNLGTHRLVLKKEDIFYLDERRTGMHLDRTVGLKDLHLTVPKTINPVLKREMAKLGAKYTNIKSIHHYQGRREGEDSFHDVFIVTFTGRDVDLFPFLAERIRFFMKPGAQFELIPNHPEEDLALDEGAVLYFRR